MALTPLMTYAIGVSAGLSAGVLFCIAIFLHVTDPIEGYDIEVEHRKLGRRH